MRNVNMHQHAVAYIRGGATSPRLFGEVSFYQKSDSVLVIARIYNLPENTSGFYGFHIHSGNGCGGESFFDTGPHYDKHSTMHPNHSGDLPPLLSFNSRAYLAVQTNRFSVNDIIGKTVVIHSGADDFTTQPAGNAGEKIGCGVIKRT